jgi:hypothetical protein
MNSILIKSTRRQNFAQVPIYGIKQVKLDWNILMRSGVYINSTKVYWQSIWTICVSST